MNLALDIGGTYTRVLAQKLLTYPTKNIDAHFFEKLFATYKPKKVAISFAGQVFNNHILSAPNVALHDIDFEALAKKYHCKLLIENDLNCAAIAEARYFGSSHLVALYSGTGLGSGIIENGTIVRGYKNLAGEIGHIPYKKAPFRCGCGKDNCIELYASGSGLQKWAKLFGVEASLENEKLFTLYLEAMEYAVATMMSLCNPEILVLGGGVIEHNPQIIKKIKNNIASFAPAFALACTITQTKLKNASLSGAKMLLEEL